jgi:hypothetical protein
VFGENGSGMAAKNIDIVDSGESHEFSNLEAVTKKRARLL